MIKVAYWEIFAIVFVVSVISCRAGIELAPKAEPQVPVMTAPSVDRGVTYVT